MVENIPKRWNDPIVAETRSVREAWAAKHGNDLRVMAEAMKNARSEWEAYGFKYIELPAKPATKLTGTDG